MCHLPPTHQVGEPAGRPPQRPLLHSEEAAGQQGTQEGLSNVSDVLTLLSTHAPQLMKHGGWGKGGGWAGWSCTEVSMARGIRHGNMCPCPHAYTWTAWTPAVTLQPESLLASTHIGMPASSGRLVMQ